jgi:hypothetical protein
MYRVEEIWQPSFGDLALSYKNRRLLMNRFFEGEGGGTISIILRQKLKKNRKPYYVETIPVYVLVGL